MSPRKFSRYMVEIGMGTNPKLARLTDSEFRAHVVGVLAVAAMATPRGCLLVGKLPAEPVDIAAAAGVPEKVAASALRKLEQVGILEPDETLKCLRIHDWDDINPSPGAERTRRWRDGSVTVERHGSVTKTSPEVKKLEVRSKDNTYLSIAELEQQVFEAWLESTGRTTRTLFEAKRHRVVRKALKMYPLDDVLDAVRGWRHSAHHRGENATGTVYNDLELLLRDAKNIEKFRDLERGGKVVPINPAVPEHLRPSDEWQAQLAAKVQRDAEREAELA